MPEAVQNVNTPAPEECTPMLRGLELREEYGWNVIPLRPGQKRPVEGFAWQRYETQKVTDAEADDWSTRYARCNYGIVCGEVSGLVVADMDTPEALDWARAHLPPCPYIVKTGRGEHWYYKYPRGKRDWLQGLNIRAQFGVDLDVQRDGKYVVGPGSIHPDTGRPYREETLWPFTELPEFALTGLGALSAASGDLSSVDLSGARANFTIIEQGNRNNALASFVGSLVAQGYGPWDAMPKVLEFNRTQCSPPLDEREAKAVVNSIFKSDKRNHVQAAAPAPAGPSPEELENYVLDTSDPLTDNPWTDYVLHPGGVMQEIMDYVEASAVRTEPVFALACAVAVMGSILGGRVLSHTGLGLHVYCVAIGSSGSGKEAPKNALIQLLNEVDPNLYAGSDVSSEVAILSHLSRPGQRRACYVFDEIGLLLQACKRPNSPKAGFVKFLTEFYTHKAVYRKEYITKDATITVPWHALSLFGLSVPSEFYAAMSDGAAVNGWLGRNMIFEVRGPRRPKKFDTLDEPPQALVEKLRALWAIDGGEVEDGPSGQNSAGGIVLAPSPARPRRLKAASKEAEKIYSDMEALIERYGGAADADEEDSVSALWGRGGEHASRLAAFHALSRAGAAALEEGVNEEDMRWGCTLGLLIQKRLVSRIDAAFFKSPFDEVCQKIRSAIQRYVRREAQKAKTSSNRPKIGAPKSYIYKALRGTPLKMIDDALDYMIQAKMLDYRENEKTSEKSNRVMNLYCLIRELREGEAPTPENRLIRQKDNDKTGDKTCASS